MVESAGAQMSLLKCLETTFVFDSEDKGQDILNRIQGEFYLTLFQQHVAAVEGTLHTQHSKANITSLLHTTQHNPNSKYVLMLWQMCHLRDVEPLLSDFM